MSLKSLVQAKVAEPLLRLLRQGVTPVRLAWSVALGATLGVIPMLGVSTLLCAAVALPLRLNVVAIQVANYVVYPLQVLLLLPFFRAGEWLFRQPPLTLKPAELAAMLKNDPWGSMQFLWDTTVHALVVWLLLGLPFTLVAFALLRPLFAATAGKMKHQATGPHRTLLCPALCPSGGQPSTLRKHHG